MLLATLLLLQTPLAARADTIPARHDALHHDITILVGDTGSHIVGIATTTEKLAALGVSAALTAVGGALYASMFLFIVPDQVLGIDVSNEIAVVAMLGGAGTLAGPIVGAIVLEAASEVFKNTFQEAHRLIFGLLLVFVVLFMPEGIVGSIKRWVSTRAARPDTAAPRADVAGG